MSTVRILTCRLPITPTNHVSLHPVNRILFLQDHIPDPQRPMTDAEVHKVIAAYLHREDDLLATLKAERRAGRPKSTRHTLLEQQRDQEQKEYESGFWIPNMQDDNNLTKLRNWKGEWISLSCLGYVRVEKAGSIKDSAFPPSGAS
jgi:translation machinery-associated protein 16